MYYNPNIKKFLADLKSTIGIILITLCERYHQINEQNEDLFGADLICKNILDL